MPETKKLSGANDMCDEQFDCMYEEVKVKYF